MDEVYRARDSSLKREVTLKVLPSFVSCDPDRLLRFEQEAHAAAAVDHPNILASTSSESSRARRISPLLGSTQDENSGEQT